jgi:hypothetical protein
MVQLTDDLVSALSREADRRGVSRSALIRQVLQDFLDAEGEEAIGRRIADGYRRVPPATPDEWGAPEAAGDESTTALLQRLDAEERLAGHQPW